MNGTQFLRHDHAVVATPVDEVVAWPRQELIETDRDGALGNAAA